MKDCEQPTQQALAPYPRHSGRARACNRSPTCGRLPHDELVRLRSHLGWAFGQVSLVAAQVLAERGYSDAAPAPPVHGIGPAFRPDEWQAPLRSSSAPSLRCTLTAWSPLIARPWSRATHWWPFWSRSDTGDRNLGVPCASTRRRQQPMAGDRYRRGLGHLRSFPSCWHGGGSTPTTDRSAQSGIRAVGVDVGSAVPTLVLVSRWGYALGGG